MAKKIQKHTGSSRAQPPPAKTPPCQAPVRYTLHPWLSNGLWLIGLGLTVGFYLLLKMFAMHPYLGDEHIYSYQAQLVAYGVTPYADFSLAHPPLQALFAAAIYKLVGYDFTITRLFPILWGLAGGVLLAAMVRRELGGIASVIATALFLLSYEPLRATSHFTGVNMTVALLLAAFFAYRMEGVRTASILCVAAVFTRLYSIPGVFMLTLWAFFEDRRKGLRMVLYGGGVGLAAFLALGFWAGFGTVIDNLVLYHAQKTPMSPESLQNQTFTVLFHNAPTIFLFVAGLMALLVVLVDSRRRLVRQTGPKAGTGTRMIKGGAVLATLALVVIAVLKHSQNMLFFTAPLFVAAAALWSGEERRFRQTEGSRSTAASGAGADTGAESTAGFGLVTLSALTALAFLAVLLTMDRVWMYYYIPAFPFAAVVGGWLGSRWLSAATRWVRCRFDSNRAGLGRARLVSGGVLLAVFLASWWYTPRLEQHLPYWDRFMQRPPAERVRTYTWRGGALPQVFEDWVHSVLWRDDRVIGEPYHRFHYLLWHESRIFDQAEPILTAIREHSEPGDWIFGDSTSVPLLAQLSGRRIAADEVDTNIMRFRSGSVDPQALAERIDDPRTRIIVLDQRAGVTNVPEIQQIVRDKYRQVGSYPTAQGRRLNLFVRSQP